MQRRVGDRVLQFAAEEFLLQNLGFDGGQPALDGGIVHEPGAPGLGGDQAGIDHVADDQIKQGLDGIVLRLGRQLAAHVLHVRQQDFLAIDQGDYRVFGGVLGKRGEAEGQGEPYGQKTGPGKHIHEGDLSLAPRRMAHITVTFMAAHHTSPRATSLVLWVSLTAALVRSISLPSLMKALPIPSKLT